MQAWLAGAGAVQILSIHGVETCPVLVRCASAIHTPGVEAYGVCRRVCYGWLMAPLQEGSSAKHSMPCKAVVAENLLL
jgi:hypothetical protein